MTAFQRFGLPAVFPLDLNKLEQAYLAIMQECHPDRFAGKSPAEKLAATQMAASINDLYHALKLPLKRAEYLLSLSGIRVGGEQDTVKPDKETLVEILELREALSEARDTATVKQLAQLAGQMQAECLKELEAAFAASNLRKAAQLTLRLGYLTKFVEEIRLTRFRASR